MPDESEAATARIPVTPSTLNRLRSTMSKSETYEDVIKGVAERREKCVHAWGRRTTWKKVCRKCGAVGQ
jgi:hypothetical protein